MESSNRLRCPELAQHLLRPAARPKHAEIGPFRSQERAEIGDVAQVVVTHEQDSRSAIRLDGIGRLLWSRIAEVGSLRESVGVEQGSPDVSHGYPPPKLR